jgi:hypothetical protein
MFKKASDAHQAAKAAAALPVDDDASEVDNPADPVDAAPGRKPKELPPLGYKSRPGKVAAFDPAAIKALAIEFYREELGPDAAHHEAECGKDKFERYATAYESITRSFLTVLRKRGIEVS